MFDFHAVLSFRFPTLWLFYYCVCHLYTISLSTIQSIFSTHRQVNFCAVVWELIIFRRC